jgi:hypothetical protein
VRVKGAAMDSQPSFLLASSCCMSAFPNVRGGVHERDRRRAKSASAIVHRESSGVHERERSLVNGGMVRRLCQSLAEAVAKRVLRIES